MHRLTQAILRDRLTPDQAAATRACTEAILAAADPGDPADPVTWPRWAQLMPHLLAADLAATDTLPCADGLRRVLVPAGPRRYPHRPCPRQPPAPAVA